MINNHVTKKLIRFRDRHVLPLFSQNNSLPDVIGIGAQKSGTTYLYYYLSQHPQLLSPRRKEAHYFDCFYNRGLNWYKSLFPPKKEISQKEHLTGKKFYTFEVTGDYIFQPLAPARISTQLPDAKFIVLLRNPIHRAYSHYHHERRQGHETLPFEEAIFQEEERIRGEESKICSNDRYYSFRYMHYSYLERGKYVLQIERWLKHFKPSQMLFIRSEAFFSDPKAHMEQIFDFLGVETCSAIQYKPHHVGDYREKMDKKTYCALVDFFSPYNEKLKQLLGDEFSWE